MNLVLGKHSVWCVIHIYIVRDTHSAWFVSVCIIHVFLMNYWHGNCAGHAVVEAWSRIHSMFIVGRESRIAWHDCMCCGGGDLWSHNTDVLIALFFKYVCACLWPSRAIIWDTVWMGHVSLHGDTIVWLCGYVGCVGDMRTRFPSGGAPWSAGDASRADTYHEIGMP